jgi:hypothetical protein
MSNPNVKIEEIRFVNNTATTKIINPERKELTIKAYIGTNEITIDQNKEIEQSKINPNNSSDNTINIEITLPENYDSTYSLFLQVTGDGVSSNQSINLSQSGAPLSADEIEKDYGLSQFNDKHMFGAQGALGKQPMQDGVLNPNELQGLDPEEKIKPFYNKTNQNTTKYATDSNMVARSKDTGLVVPITDEGVDHNIEIYKTNETEEIQKHLDFCNNIQSLYIDKHEELKTVFALTLNLFQFYSYSLNVIEKLIKAYAAKKEENIFSIQREHIIYLPENTTEKLLPIDYYSSDSRQIEFTAKVENLNTDLHFIKCLQETPNADNNVIFKKGQKQLSFDLSNAFASTSIASNNLYIFFNENRIFQDKPVSIKYSSKGKLMLHIQIVTPTVKTVEKPIITTLFTPPISPFTSQPDPVSGPGGEVYFKKFSNINELKNHQKALKKQLQTLHEVIIKGPEMATSTFGGKLPIQGGGKKKKKTESININEAINDLIGGNKIFDIFNYYQNEIVKKEDEYYFVDIEGSFEPDKSKNVLNLKRTNSSNNKITFTKLTSNTSNKFEKSLNSVIYLEKDNGFQNENISGDLINKFTKLKHLEMRKLLGEVNPDNLNKPIFFDSDFYKKDNEVYKSLFEDL